eukprot:291422-Prorocentrum_lima.AAC.1
MKGLVVTAHQQEGSSKTINALKYKLPGAASYINDRKSATFLAEANDYNPQGIRVIQVELVGDGFADLSTLKMYYRFTNTSGDAQSITPLPSPPPNPATQHTGGRLRWVATGGMMPLKDQVFTGDANSRAFSSSSPITDLGPMSFAVN